MIGQMERMLINFSFLLLLFAGCSPTGSEPVPSLPGASQLSPTLKAGELAEFRSEDKGIIIAYPDGLALRLFTLLLTKACFHGKEVFHLHSRCTLLKQWDPT
jgi:hypothetical protein